MRREPTYRRRSKVSWMGPMLLVLIMLAGHTFTTGQITPGKNQVHIFGQVTNNITGSPIND
ncbi:MAG: hypothetical protein K8R53_13000, partial [Bacteroidales bacterium]|nr:hypothetical protein [Bacteroidales bacterium]